MLKMLGYFVFGGGFIIAFVNFPTEIMALTIVLFIGKCFLDMIKEMAS